MLYLDFLADVHNRLNPRAYLEIGVRNGVSLSLSHCRSVGIDPAFSIFAELDTDVALFRTTSDEYFSRPDPLSATRGRPFDLSFIDGLHLFEYALRDFIFAERHSSNAGVIVFDDVLPRSVDEAARERHTGSWTGDVFRVLQVLVKYRPDLIVIPLDTAPTGLLAVVGLDPANAVLSDQYDSIMSEFRQPDPQDVPEELLDRLSVVAPRRFLDSGVLELLASSHDQIVSRPELERLVMTQIGIGYVGASTL